MPRQPKIRSVFLVYKRSAYQRFFIEEKNALLRKLLRDKHVSVRSLIETHDVHQNAVRRIQAYFKRRGVAFRSDSRHQLAPVGKVDLVITLGGDGTFLRTSHFVRDQPVLPVNSDPENSVGALCSVTAANFRRKMDAVLEGDYAIKKLPLIRVRVNGKTLPVSAANDVLFTNASPAATSRYFILHGESVEEQKSSGVWIATATGSTAAISAAGGEIMKSGDTRLQFATREPYQGTFNPYRVTHGFVKKGDTLKIVNNMMHARLYIDGPTTRIDLQYGDEIAFSLAPRTLKVIA